MIYDAEIEEGKISITSECTFANDLTFNNQWTAIKKRGNQINGIVRFTTPSTVTADKSIIKIPQKYRSVDYVVAPALKTWTGEIIGVVIISPYENNEGYNVLLAASDWQPNQQIVCYFNYTI